MSDHAQPQPPDDLAVAKHAHFADTVDDIVRASTTAERAAAISAFQQAIQNIGDQTEWLNALHVPEDAGVYAEGLAQILRRIPVGWGRWISCGAGWYAMLVELDQQIAALIPDYQIHQVKEKFGALRFYWSAGEAVDEDTVAQARELVRDAELASEQLCERCGEPGTLRRTQSAGPWLSTTCDEHAFDRNGAVLLTEDEWKVWWADEQPRYEARMRDYEIKRWEDKRTLLVGAAGRDLAITHRVIDDEAEARAAALEDWDGVWIGSGAAADAFVAALAQRHAPLRAEIERGRAAAKEARTGYAYPRMPGIGELSVMDRDTAPDMSGVRDLGRHVGVVSERILA